MRVPFGGPGYRHRARVPRATRPTTSRPSAVFPITPQYSRLPLTERACNSRSVSLARFSSARDCAAATAGASNKKTAIKIVGKRFMRNTYDEMRWPTSALMRQASRLLSNVAFPLHATWVTDNPVQMLGLTTLNKAACDLVPSISKRGPTGTAPISSRRSQRDQTAGTIPITCVAPSARAARAKLPIRAD